jgi:uncharacterized protein (DUF1786 family)
MKILCLDIGSATQDILFLDTAQPIENAVQLILPSPTIIAAGKIEAATRERKNIVLNGATMGGGACTSAVKGHLAAGLQVFAQEAAARTFDDDLDEVASWGIKIITGGEKAGGRDSTTITLADMDIDHLRQALAGWNIDLHPDAVAVAVLDHGVAPKGESDRLWRFRYLEQLLRADRTLEAFMFSGTEIPSHFSRLQAVAGSFKGDAPLVLMDTGAAAVLGICLDPVVAEHENRLAVNMGNSHTLAFNLQGMTVLGFFEHHTSALSAEQLENLLQSTVAGTIRGQDIREEGGHGGLIFEKGGDPFVAVTGPRRSRLARSRLKPYFASPFGSMMLTGCYGLLKAAAIKLPRWRGEIEAALSR